MGPRLAAPATGRRSRLWLLFAVAVVAFLAIRGVIAWQDTGDNASPVKTGASPSPLPARTIDAGEVTVKIQPRQLDAKGAVFEIVFDTHSADLDQDLVRQTRLTVDGISWPVAAWSGDGPGGHHREGNLRFRTGGPPTGRATLSIDGLPKPVTATWEAVS